MNHHKTKEGLWRSMSYSPLPSPLTDPQLDRELN